MFAQMTGIFEYVQIALKERGQRSNDLEAGGGDLEQPRPRYPRGEIYNKACSRLLRHGSSGASDQNSIGMGALTKRF